MSRRLRVLISAYACEPGKGSEPEVGWQWALQMARFHDVTVLTRTNNQPNIEAGLLKLPAAQPRPSFVYHDLPPGLVKMKQLTRGVKWYYLLWQRSAHCLVAKLHQEHRFDLLHHVTFAGFRFSTAIWGHGTASLWGPVGGIQAIPAALQPWHHPPALVNEGLRQLNNWSQTILGTLRRRARASTMILASTPETLATFARLGFASRLMPTIGLETDAWPKLTRGLRRGTLRCLFVGNIITLKGVDLALDALARSKTTATFTLIGSGSYTRSARRRTEQLGIADRVNFLGHLRRPEVIDLLPEFDVFLLPSLHDTGSFALIEAMLQEMPAICLDCGGPAVAVTPECGLKVPLASRSEVVRQLTAAIQRYDRDRELLLAHGRAARLRILHEYDWLRKGEAMNEVYLQTSRRFEAAVG